MTMDDGSSSWLHVCYPTYNALPSYSTNTNKKPKLQPVYRIDTAIY